MFTAPRNTLSVGIDVGTTTTQTVFSELTLHDVARPGQVPRIQVDERAVLYTSDVQITPLLDADTIDAEALAAMVESEYRRAGFETHQIDTGAVIITGEAARSGNAAAVLDALSGTAGDFVVTIAGPNAEAQIAGRGSGVARWSADHYEQVTTVDIGGGTTNAAIFRCGQHLGSSAVAVGGRQIELDASGRITGIPAPGLRIADKAGLHPNQIATVDQLRNFCDIMADLIVDLICGIPADPLELQLTDPLRDTTASTSIFLTGGVADCYYSKLPAESLQDICRFGDVGPLLADSLRRNLRFQKLNVLEPPETLHATVLGAAGQTVTLSGSTIWAETALLPLRNLPVLRPVMAGSGGELGFAEGVAAARARWDLDAETLVAIVVDLPQGLGFSRLTALAEEIASYHQVAGASLPLVLIMAQDYAKVLGQTINSVSGNIRLLVIDQVGLGEGDFIDIGQPLLDGRAVPLSIKTLVFYE